MTLMTALSQSLLLVLLLTSTSSGFQCGSGCVSCDTPPNCKNVSAVYQTLSQATQNSPYYQIVASGPRAGGGSPPNGCYTYLPVNENTYLQFITVNFGCSVQVQVYYISDLYPGVYRVTGVYGSSEDDFTVHNAYILGAVCSGSKAIIVSYRCYLADDCNFVYPKYDIVYGLSTSPEGSLGCINKYEDLIYELGLRVNNFMESTGEPRCVTSFYGQPCINAGNVDPAYAIPYPQYSCSDCCSR